jgi:hypothetical protein
MRYLLAAVMRSPIVWGLLASAGFFGLIHNNIIPGSEFLKRYTTEEAAESIETTFFFIGFAEILLKASEIADQRKRIRNSSLLGEKPATPQPASSAGELLQRLAALPSHLQEHYLPRRLREVLEAIHIKGSANSLVDDVKYLAGLDADRSHAGFAFLRIVIWSIPIWGFLGTVIGITDAIAHLNPESMEGSLNQVTSSLGHVFDTTALALALSIGLMFGQYFVDRAEQGLLSGVDERTLIELDGRFERTTDADKTPVGMFEDVARKLLDSAAEMVDRRIETAFGEALTASVRAHAESLATAAESAAERNQIHWEHVQHELRDCSQSMQSQSKLLMRLVEATGEVARLEDTLNRNFSALAGAQHFQETLLNLSAAINLLNARIGQVAPTAMPVALKGRPLRESA